MSKPVNSAESATRRAGFTCPKCGCHYFGTFVYHQAMGERYPHGTNVGQCHAKHYGVADCKHEWNRDIPEQEAQNMYEATPEEWERQWKKLHQTLDNAPFYPQYPVKD